MGVLGVEPMGYIIGEEEGVDEGVEEGVKSVAKLEGVDGAGNREDELGVRCMMGKRAVEITGVYSDVEVERVVKTGSMLDVLSVGVEGGVVSVSVAGFGGSEGVTMGISEGEGP